MTTSAMNQLYQQVILDHARTPRGKGLVEPYAAEVMATNPTCGDQIVLRATVRDGIITGISHQPEGCSISIAGASVMTELVVGLPVLQALERYDEFARLMRSEGEPAESIGDGVAFAGVAKFPARVKCAMLGWGAMKKAIIEASAKDEAGVEKDRGPAQERTRGELT